MSPVTAVLVVALFVAVWVILELGRRYWLERSLRKVYEEGYHGQCAISDQWRLECFRMAGIAHLYQADPGSQP